MAKSRKASVKWDYFEAEADVAKMRVTAFSFFWNFDFGE
jgi:hypothetical protein